MSKACPGWAATWRRCGPAGRPTAAACCWSIRATCSRARWNRTWARAQAMVAGYNALGYAAAAIGNHEFDFGPAGPAHIPARPDQDPRGALKARAAAARFPFLASQPGRTRPAVALAQRATLGDGPGGGCAHRHRGGHHHGHAPRDPPAQLRRPGGAPAGARAGPIRPRGAPGRGDGGGGGHPRRRQLRAAGRTRAISTAAWHRRGDLPGGPGAAARPGGRDRRWPHPSERGPPGGGDRDRAGLGRGAGVLAGGSGVRSARPEEAGGGAHPAAAIAV